MKRENFLLSLPIFLLIGMLVWRSKVEINQVDQISPRASELWERKDVYFPSPLERDLLNRHQRLWPRLFSIKEPPRARTVQKIFTLLHRYNLDHRFQAELIERLRQWSVFTSLGARAELMRALHGEARDYQPQTFEEAFGNGYLSDAEKCSVFYKERLFRVAQTWPKFMKKALALFESCDPRDLNLLTLKLRVALSQEDRKALHELFEVLAKEEKGQRVGAFDQYYSRVLWNVVDYALNQELKN